MPLSLLTHWCTLCLSLLVPRPVSANLPFASKIPQLVHKHSNEVSFDPLGVAAVLHNPRASASAARLYTQPDRTNFRWPHAMMIGGALAPLSVLVDSLTSGFSSMDPAVSMCLAGQISLPVRSTMWLPQQSAMTFPELPVSLSNSWLRDILAFKPSRYPENDFAAVVVGEEEVLAEPQITGISAILRNPTLASADLVRGNVRLAAMVLDAFGFLCGLLLLVGLVFSALTGDVWAAVLFGLYTAHWFAGTVISFHPLVKPSISSVLPDSTTEYCVYQRPRGGTVVFMGRRDTFGRRVRTTLTFDRSGMNHFLHWLWVGTGSLAAISSMACMVNMAAYLQLGFLGVLGYSSLAEIVATQVARKLQAEAHKVLRKPAFMTDNETRTMGIIRVTLLCQLDTAVWHKLNLLPRIALFDSMFRLLDELRSVHDEKVMRLCIAQFGEQFGNEDGRRLAAEAEGAWRELRAREV